MSRTLSGLFVVSAVDRLSKRKSTSQESHEKQEKSQRVKRRSLQKSEGNFSKQIRRMNFAGDLF